MNVFFKEKCNFADMKEEALPGISLGAYVSLSSEIFVLIVFITALPICVSSLKSTSFPEKRTFLFSYVCFLLSNVCTVLETWFFETILDLFEHLFMSLGAFFLLWAIWKWPKKTSFSMNDKVSVEEK